MDGVKRSKYTELGSRGHGNQRGCKHRATCMELTRYAGIGINHEASRLGCPRRIVWKLL
jgi:hypothetical protein